MNRAAKSKGRTGAQKRQLKLGGKGLPLYRRVKLEMTRLLSSGGLGPNDLLPTEKQLAARFAVSVGTIRRAMDDLAAEHIVIRQQGRGTSLVAFSPDRMLNRFWPVFRKDGVRQIPIVQTILFEKSRANAETAQALAITRGDETYHIINLLLMSGSPVLLDEIHLPEVLFPDLNEHILVSREMTMYGLYQERYAVNVVRTLDRLHGVVATQEAARRLGVTVGSPLLSCTRIAYTFDNKRVELRHTLLNTQRYEYRNAIGDESRTG